jgi:hypothetical protein
MQEFKKILQDPLELCIRFCIWIFAADGDAGRQFWARRI